MGSCGHHEEAFDDRDEIFVLTINRLLRNCSIRHTPSEAILVTDGASQRKNFPIRRSMPSRVVLLFVFVADSGRGIAHRGYHCVCVFL